MTDPIVTIVIPSFNQGRFLDKALSSVFEQSLDVEVFVMDGGSVDESLAVIKKWESKLAGWRSQPDDGQAAAINEGMMLGSAPYVCWLNSDDFYYANALSKLKLLLDEHAEAPMVYGKAWNVNAGGSKANPYPTRAFSARLFANYCLISQPATLIRRQAWEEVGGLDLSLDLAFDYDLWWRLYLNHSEPIFLREYVAANRMHSDTKTHNNLDQHYDESIAVVRQHYGSVPVKWLILRPVMRTFRALVRAFRK